MPFTDRPCFCPAATSGSGPLVIGLLTLLLGLSNGYLTSCSMIGAPERVPASAAALAGNLMVLSLVLGLCIGAACGFLWLL
jgi:equilibrative nucleoside transporter 1/2/3